MAETRDRARERLVRVAVAETLITAQMLQEQLAQAGIRSMLKNRDGTAVAMGGSYAQPFAMELFVLEGDADAASALLGGPPPPAVAPPALAAPPPKQRRWWHLFR